MKHHDIEWQSVIVVLRDWSIELIENLTGLLMLEKLDLAEHSVVAELSKAFVEKEVFRLASTLAFTFVEVTAAIGLDLASV